MLRLNSKIADPGWPGPLPGDPAGAEVAGQAALELYRAARRGVLLQDGCEVLRAALDCPWLALLRLSVDARGDRVLGCATQPGVEIPTGSGLPAVVRRVMGTQPIFPARGVPALLPDHEGGIWRSNGAAPDMPFAVAWVGRDCLDCCLLVVGCSADAVAEGRVLAVALQLLPHLAEAFLIALELEQRRIRTQLATAVLDHAPNGYLLLDTDGMVLLANEEAQRITQAGEGVTMRSRRLLVMDAGFRHALEQALDDLATVPQPSVRILEAERPSGAVPFMISLLPVVLSGAQALDPRRRWLLVVITDPAAPKLPSADCLVSVFGLTSAEARICLPVAAGRELEAVAGDLSVSLATVRTHLRNVYHKLQVRSRVALVKRLQGHCWSAAPVVIAGTVRY